MLIGTKMLNNCSLPGALSSAIFYALCLNLPTHHTYRVTLYNKIFPFYPSLSHNLTHTHWLIDCLHFLWSRVFARVFVSPRSEMAVRGQDLLDLEWDLKEMKMTAGCFIVRSLKTHISMGKPQHRFLNKLLQSDTLSLIFTLWPMTFAFSRYC